MSPSELIATKMLGLLDHPRGSRLQATVIAMACMGVYSEPDGVTVDADLLNLTTDMIESKGCFPLRTMAECVSAFDAALVAHTANQSGLGTGGQQ